MLANYYKVNYARAMKAYMFAGISNALAARSRKGQVYPLCFQQKHKVNPWSTENVGWQHGYIILALHW